MNETGAPAADVGTDRYRPPPVGEHGSVPAMADLMAAAVAAVPDGIAVLGPVRDRRRMIADFVWQAANPAAERMIGRGQLAGTRLRVDAVGECLFSTLLAACEASGAGSGIQTVARPDGTAARWRITAAPAAEGLCVTLAELGSPAAPAITATEAAAARALADMQMAKREAERANRAKSQFLAHMSHELRTPLNAVLGFSELLLAETFGPLGNPRYRDYAADIRDSGAHLLALINDILDLSRIETGQLPLEEEGIDLAEVATQALRMTAPRALKGNVRLGCDIAEGLPLLCADSRATLQMLLNLLTNAVKFTPPDGDVMLSAMLLPDGGIGVMVADTGPGIPAEDLERMLEPFERGDGEIARKSGGTGLGLPIVKRLVERHGGRLELTSEPDFGTTAILVFPPSRSIPRVV